METVIPLIKLMALTISSPLITPSHLPGIQQLFLPQGRVLAITGKPRDVALMKASYFFQFLKKHTLYIFHCLF